MTANKFSNYPNGFPNGVTIKNLPVLNLHSGNVFWVDSGAGNDNNKGTFSRPLATFDQAMTLCTANNGDVVCIKAGHAESIADATTFQVDKAGVTIIGLGNGNDRPTFTVTATGATVEIDSANTIVQNLIFNASASAIGKLANVDAADVMFDGIQVGFDDTGDEFLVGFDVTDVDRFRLYNSRWQGEPVAAADSVVKLDNCDNFEIVGNWMYGQFNEGAIHNDTSGDTGDSAPQCFGGLIAHNTIYNGDTSAGNKGIAMKLSSTGIMHDNRIGVLSGDTTGANDAIDPASFLCMENYVANVAGESGGLVPQTTST